MTERDMHTDTLIPTGHVPEEIALNEDLKSIDGSNWTQPANRWWGFLNQDKLIPNPRNVPCGSGYVHEFGKGKRLDLSDLRLDYYEKDTPFEDAMKFLHNQALVVVHDNDIVFERYREGMTEQDRHTWMSVSKTSIPMVMGGLVDAGQIDLNNTFAPYYASPVGCWTDASIQATADMNLILDHYEIYDDPHSDHLKDEVACGYREPVNDEERQLAAMGARKRMQSIDTPASVSNDNQTRYDSVNTTALQFLCEDVSGQSFYTLFRDNVWAHIGAEKPAGFIADSQNTVDTGGGIFSTTRDLARYGLIFANKGVAPDGTRVFSEDWIDELRRPGAGTVYPYGKNYRYHNQTKSNGSAIAHMGWGGQLLYVVPEKKLIVAAFSALTVPSAADCESANLLLNLGDTIADMLPEV